MTQRTARPTSIPGRAASQLPGDLADHVVPIADADIARAKNSFAWLLLTCEPEEHRNPEEALGYALAATELTEHGVPDYLDTLALAYQETGQTQRAIETQRSAIALTPEDSSERTEYQERLAELEVALTASR